MWSDQAREAAIAARAKSGAKPTNLIGQGAIRGGTSNAGIRDYFDQQKQQFGSYTGPDRRGAGEYPDRNIASNKAAADALFAGVKSGVVPVHDSMGGAMSSPTTAPSPQNRRAGDGVMKGQTNANLSRRGLKMNF